ncbi:sensor histidine kinase [Nitrincola tibetensis]|uniref:Sensor histidine kinase n=1 Tax=Nitrincola tibetensis TaxID=2219697 RepID=A0A364NJX1_9GAMM|nr:histidine kinase [Nitrincola tibetensis]RAU17366.1 sensor histidine kinase [Nitrincola tibetensis]
MNQTIQTSVCQSKIVLRAIVLAQAVAILMTLAPGVLEDRWYRLGLTTLFVQWVNLLTLLLLCQYQKHFGQNSPRQLAAVAFLLLLSSTAAVSLIAFHLLTQQGWQTQAELSTFIFHNLLIASIVGVIGLQFYIMHHERQQRIAAQSRAELDALQARIRPHFLFNSLNTVAELTQQDPQAAEEALLNLSALFRAALKAGETSTLVDELRIVDSYLSLEHWRLGTRLQVSRHFPEQLPSILLPSLTLQPLIENAVRHGVEGFSQPSLIRIELMFSQKNLTLLIENPLPPHCKARFEGNGIAIDNIRQRLALLYDDRAKLTTGAIENQYRVKLVIPFDDTKA